MDRANGDRELNQITTCWTVICQAHEGPADAVLAAREELLRRYGPAVHRYLLAAVRDPHAADELSQEFALRFLRGDLRGADPQRGKFRHFVKGVLLHVIADHYRRQRVRPQPLPEHGLEPAAPAEDTADSDRQFIESWRDELLNRAWKALEQAGLAFYAVLRFRAEHIEVRSAQMAEQLSAQLGRPVTRDWVRQTLHRARDKFADILVGEVVQTLDNPTADELEEELIDLGLLDYCRPALQRFRGAS